MKLYSVVSRPGINDKKILLFLQENRLTSLAGGGNVCDLSLLQILDLHSNCFVCLPDEIGHLRNLQVSTNPVSSMECVW